MYTCPFSSLKNKPIDRSESIEWGVVLIIAEEMLQYSKSLSIAQIRSSKHPIEIDDFDQELYDIHEISR